jgi:glutathione S-transferase
MQTTREQHMSNIHLLIGAENSPYSIKVRSYLRYKGIPHAWLKRGQAQDVYQQHAKLPLIPLLVTPDGEGIQDSTPIVEALEARFPEPSIVPADPIVAFVATLLEEFGDEWGNKWMFHYRWARDADQRAAARRLVQDGNPALAGDALAQMAATVRERMVPRVWFVGSNDLTAPQIEASFAAALGLLETHLGTRPFIAGGRPCSADFALWGQVYNAAKDPTPASILAAYPGVQAWLARLVEPFADGEFEGWDSLAPTLMPFLQAQVAGLFLPWSDANARAIATGAEEFEVQLASGRWVQKPQKYHARSLATLRGRYAAARSAALDAVLDSAGALRWLQG